MQIAAPIPAAPSHAPASVSATAGAPRFRGGIEFSGEGRFTAFSAKSVGGAYGEAAGYGSLQQAINSLTLVTVGAHLPAAGVFEREGRFYGRRLQTTVTFASGATWSGPWRLEQHPADLELVNGSATGTTTRVDALRAIVDGAQSVEVGALPVAAKPAPAPATP